MNVLIVEDELQTALMLQEVIEQDADFMVVEKLESVTEAVQYLSKYQNNLDLLFFDIQLSDGKSFEIFKHVDVTVPVVFCTAYDEFTMQAIKSNGIDYILKPFRDDEIHQALLKYKKMKADFHVRDKTPLQFATENTNIYQQVFLAQFREKTILKKVEDIALFTIETEIVYIYTFDGDKFPFFKNLEYIESVCDPQKFFRINRQFLVNKNAVISFEPFFNRKISLHLKIKSAERPIVSRLKVNAFKYWLEK